MMGIIITFQYYSSDWSSCVQNNGAEKTNPLISEKYTDTSKDCQISCTATEDCNWFVWEEDDKSCWLLPEKGSHIGKFAKIFYGVPNCPGINGYFNLRILKLDYSPTTRVAITSKV